MPPLRVQLSLRKITRRSNWKRRRPRPKLCSMLSLAATVPSMPGWKSGLRRAVPAIPNAHSVEAAMRGEAAIVAVAEVEAAVSAVANLLRFR